MKKIFIFLFGLLLLTVSARATAPWQGLTTTNGVAAGSQVLPHRQLLTTAITWNAATTARYLMVFDGVALPSNGATTTCTVSHVTGCLLWCGFLPNSTSAPNLQTLDWTVHPLSANFGLVLALSTGAGCGTLTVDGANDFFTSQAQ